MQLPFAREKRTMNLSIFSACFLVISAVQAADKFTCPAAEIDTFDVVTARIIALNEHQRRFPKAKSEIDTYCSETKNDIKRAGDIIVKCFTGTAKQFATIILYAVKKTINLYCGPKGAKKKSARLNTRQEELIAMAGCITKNEKEAHKCLSGLSDAIQRGKRAESNRIGYACCHYYKLLGCLETITKDKCTLKASDTMQEFIRNLFQSIVDVACGDNTENSDKCDHLPPPPKKRKSDKPTRSVFLPLVELWNNL